MATYCNYSDCHINCWFSWFQWFYCCQ